MDTINERGGTMKHFTAAILIGLLVALLVPSVSDAQVSPQYATAIARNAFEASDVDTSGAVYVGSAKLISAIITTEDSAAFDVYVQYQTNGTWTTVVTDSLISTSNTGTTKEFSIRDTDSDALDGIYFPIRLIVSVRATGQGVTSAYYRGRFYYSL